MLHRLSETATKRYNHARLECIGIIFFFDPQKEYRSTEQIDTANDSRSNHVDVPSMKLVVWCPRDEKCDVLHRVCVIHGEVHGTINYMAVMGSVSAGNDLPLQSRSNESSKYLHRHPVRSG